MKIKNLKNVKFQEDFVTKGKKGSFYLKKKDIKKALKSVKSKDVKKLAKEIPASEIENIKNFYNKVILDGRYIEEFKTDPKGVAKKLNLDISKKTIKAINKASSIVAGSGGAVSSTTELVAVAIIVLVLATPSPAENNVVIDRSGLMKF